MSSSLANGSGAFRAGIGVLLVAAAGVATPAMAVTLTRGPYLQLLTTHSVTVVWNTDTPAACALAMAPLGGSATSIAGGSGRVCAIAVEGLTPGAEYGYIPLANGTALRSESIFQADDPSLPFTFIAVGDTGDGSSGQLAVRDRMLGSSRDMILHTGDMIYPSGAAGDWNPKFFTPYANLIRGVVFWPCLGNHDVETSSGQPWRDAFWTPANNAAGSENYYSFDFGNAHFAMVDSNASLSSGSAQYRFLDADLGASGALWKFVAFHHPIYSSGGSSSSIRSSLAPLFDRQGVDMVFMGHVHNYERTKPLRGGQVVPAGQGTVYVTTGAGGRLGSGGSSSFTAYAEAALHFTRVAIDGGTLRLEMVRKDGAIRDTMTLVKGAAATTTTTTRPPTTTTTGFVTTTTSTTAAPATTTTAPPGATVPFTATADTYVDASSATGNFGTATLMTADAGPECIAYLRFVVGGLGTQAVTRALLRVQADSGSSADSDSGGRVHRISNDAWVESAVTYNSKPQVDGQVLASWGTVALGQVVDFDVTGTVTGDGSYSFALDSLSGNGVRYRTREASSGRPQLIVTLAGAGGPATTTTTTTAPATTTTTTTTTIAAPATTTTTAPPGATVQLTAAADTYVDASSATGNFGTATLMTADADPESIAYLRFVVSGLGTRAVTRAILRVQAETGSSADSNSGGSVHRISDDSWQETGLTYNTRPAVDGPPLATQGAVALGQVVDFDVTGAVTVEGSYTFAIDSLSGNGVRYRTREASAGRPLLVLTLGP